MSYSRPNKSQSPYKKQMTSFVGHSNNEYRWNQSRKRSDPSQSTSRDQRDEDSNSAKRHPPNVNLITNAYSVNIRKSSNITIYEYTPTITLSEGYRDITSNVLFRNFVSKSLRKTIMDYIIPKVLHNNYSKGTVIIEHNLNAIYSCLPFRDHQQVISEIEGSLDTTFKFDNVPVETDLLCNLRVDVDLKFARTFLFDDAVGHIHATFINSILHHQLWLSMLKYGAVYFLSHESYFQDHRQEYRTRELDLISKHVMGLSMSRLKKTSNNETIVVIHCPHSYITGSHRLIDLLCSFVMGHSTSKIRLRHDANDDEIKRCAIRELSDIKGTERWFADLCSILDGFKCKAVGLNETRGSSLRFNITDESASSLLIADDKDFESSITVADYYRRAGINLNYPNLPCLKSRSTQQFYYPFEMCSLLPDQKVPIFRLSSAARVHLNLLNKPKPDFSFKSSFNAKSNIESITKDELEAFGITFSKIPVKARGTLLKKPYLQFKNHVIKPETDHWESKEFYQAIELGNNWCVINTVEVDMRMEDLFFQNFSKHGTKYGLQIGRAHYIYRDKEDLLNNENSIAELIQECQNLTRGLLRLILFVIDSNSGNLNRLVHLSLDNHCNVSATCLRLESMLNNRQHRSIYRSLSHKLNARLGGTNLIYHNQTLSNMNLKPKDLLIIGLDVTHPDNELKGSSIVGCAYTYSPDLFKHRSLVWPQTARVEIIGKLDVLFRHILQDYKETNKSSPKYIIVYRDGVSHEEFEKVHNMEVKKALQVLTSCFSEKNRPKPILSYIIAQKRHSLRFFQQLSDKSCKNPPSGTLIDKDIVSTSAGEFYLYSNTSFQATARPIHYHILFDDGLGIERIKLITYVLCFNYGLCSNSISMPTTLRYAHNAAYDARNRVIASREFDENKFYTSKFFC